MLNSHIFLLNDNIIYSTNDINSDILFSDNYTNTNTNTNNGEVNNSIPLNKAYAAKGKIGSFYKTLKNKTKRRLCWELIEQDRNKYKHYKQYKNSWDPNTSIRKEVKMEVKSVYEEYKKVKNTIIWLLNRRRPRQ